MKIWLLLRSRTCLQCTSTFYFEKFSKIYLRDLIENSSRGSLRKGVIVSSRRGSRVSLCANPISRDGSRKSLFSAKKTDLTRTETNDTPELKKGDFYYDSEDSLLRKISEGTRIDFDIDVDTYSETLSPIKTSRRKSAFSEF